VSLPTRERGLKLDGIEIEYTLEKSLPTRERGLKLHGRGNYRRCTRVAPYAGAWIETSVAVRQSE